MKTSIATRITDLLTANPAGLSVAIIAKRIGASKCGTNRAMTKGADAAKFRRYKGQWFLAAAPAAAPVIATPAAIVADAKPKFTSDPYLGFTVESEKTGTDLIVERLNSMLCRLSPENISCDGEASRTHIRKQMSLLTKGIKAELAKAKAIGFTIPANLMSEIESYIKPSTYAPAKKSGFAKGDKVTFQDRSGCTVGGTVTRVNKKTLTVHPFGVAHGRYWRVSPRLCTKAA